MNSRGQIVSFYSFKGGVGRTMALANIACLLARPAFGPGTTRKRVLMIDWDLESPGLHHYFFREGLPRKTQGLLELLLDVNVLGNLVKDASAKKQYSALSGRLDAIQWQDYYHRVPTDGSDALDLWFMPHSGKSAGEYHNDLFQIDWRTLDEKAPWAIPLVVRRLAQSFDFVLIDSRTGLSDIGLVCGMIPDKLVFVFNFNRQSTLGSLAYFTKLLPVRRELAEAGNGDPLTIFPLPSMIQEGIPRDFDYWINNDVSGVKVFLEDTFKDDGGLSKDFWARYIPEYCIPYVSQLAYGDQVIAREAKLGEHAVVKRYERFASMLAQSDSPCLNEPGGEQQGWSTHGSTDGGTSTDDPLTLSVAASFIERVVDTDDAWQRMGGDNVEKIRSFAHALRYEWFGPRIIEIARHYVATADAAADHSDRWAPIWFNYARETISEAEQALEKLKRRELPPGFSSVDGGFWSAELWKRAGKWIWTTNVAGVGQSMGRRLDLAAIKTQGQTVKRNVPVTRVFVLEEFESNTSRKTLRNIIEAQYKEGIGIYVIDRSTFDGVKGQAEDELGSEDFMIVDDLFVYVTERKKAESSIGSSAPKRIRILNSGREIRLANHLRRQIQASATKIDSVGQIERLIPASSENISQ